MREILQVSSVSCVASMCVQCESNPPWVFWQFFFKRLGIFSPNYTHSLIIPIYAGLLIFYLIRVYLQFWRSYAILSATTQFTPHFQNVHHRPKHVLFLAFSDIFPKELGIFGPNFTHLLHVPIYARLQTLIQLSPTVTKLGNIKYDHTAKSRSLVKCGIAECGMRKVKCGIEKCGNGCGMVGKMRNAEKLKWGVNLRITQYLDHAWTWRQRQP